MTISYQKQERNVNVIVFQSHLIAGFHSENPKTKVNCLEILKLSVDKKTEHIYNATQNPMKMEASTMRQCKFGKTGLTVSEIGMGTWELGGREWGDSSRASTVVVRFAFWTAQCRHRICRKRLSENMAP